MERAVLLALLAGVAGCLDSAATQGGSDGGVTQPAADLDGFRQHCLDGLNGYRSQASVAPLVRTAALDDFAQAGSLQLSMDHVAHAHFSAAAQNGTLFSSGFAGGAAENQGDPDGWFVAPEATQIDQILAAMIGEGPGGGHHDAILGAGNRKVGIGLVEDSAGRLFFTNDFSP